MIKGVVLHASTAAVAIVAVMASAPAGAQSAAKAATQRTESDGPDDIVVTATHLLPTTFDSPVPVRTLGKEDFDEHGYMDLGEALSDLPGVDTDINLSNNQSSTRDNGISTVELRGAGRNRTLTLIDGLRTVSDSSTGNAVNLATIPAFFVRRIDVSTGGASATYGSDAIAGVVNIITEDRLDGIKARVIGNATNDGGGDSTEYSFAAGHKFGDRLYIMGAVTYQKQNPLLGKDRDWALQAVHYNDNANTIIPANLDESTPGGHFVISNPHGYQAYYYDASGLHPNYVSSVNGFDPRPTSTLITQRETLSSALKLRYDITDSIRFSSTLLYSHIQTFTARPAISLSSPDLYGPGTADEYEVGGYLLSNPFVPQALRDAYTAFGGVGSIDFNRRLVELGTLGAYNTRQTWRGSATLEGKVFGAWHWDLTYGYGRYQQDQVRRNAVNYLNAHYALNATTIDGKIVCADATARANGCVPLNLFGIDSITPEMADYIRDSEWFQAINVQESVNGDLTGSPFSLPAGPVQLAVGFDLQRVRTQTHSDQIGAEGVGYWQYTPEYAATIKSAEAYVETALPLLRDRPFFYRLSVDGSARVSQYNIAKVGTTFSYRAGAQWSPVRGLGFRGIFSRAQRAPTTTDLYSPSAFGVASVNDICDGVNAKTIAIGGVKGIIGQNCLADPNIAAVTRNGKSTFQSYGDDFESPTQGNPNLKEEVADTLTAGVVLRPHFLSGFGASVDYYDIKIKNAIRTITLDDLLFACYSSPVGQPSPYCSRITRNSDGQISLIVNQVENVAQMRRRGIDVSLAYRFNLRSLGIPGTFNAAAQYTRSLELTSRFGTPGNVQVLDGLGEVGDAKDVAQASISWNNRRIMLRWTTHYIGPAIDDNEEISQFAESGIANPLFLHVPSYTRHDLSFAFIPSLRKPNLRVFGTIKNVFNKYGPFLPDGTESGNINNYNSYYGVTGRLFSLGIQTQF